MPSPSSLPPTPVASSDATRRAMQGNRRVDTAPEVALRKLLHAAGYRYRKDAKVEADGFRVRPDIVFRKRRLAVFVDGCFWHGCPDHCRMPSSNTDYWEAKIGRNRSRDARNDVALRAAGWRVLRFWEHDDPAEAAAEVIEELEREVVTLP